MSKLLETILLAALMLVLCGAALAATLELPASLTAIKAETFAGDIAIETVVVPEGVTSIESKAFANSGLDLIQLPSSLTSIAPDAFEGVSNFKAVAAEGTWAYTYCTENNIPIQAYTQTTPAEHFKYDEEIRDGVKGWQISGANSQLADVVVPGEIEGKPVFYVSPSYYWENEALRSIYYPDSLVYTEVTETENLSSVSFASTTQADFTGIKTLESVIVREGIERANYDPSIDNSAFKDCTNLKSVIISDDVQRIESYAFQNCTSLTEIKLPKSLEDIHDSAFDGCTNLQKIEGAYSRYSINSNTFRNCKKLESLVLLDNVYNIDATAFEGCENLPLTVMPGSDAIKKCDELGLKYTVAEYGYGKLNDKAELEFTGYAGTNPKLVIPSEAYGIPVSSIGYKALLGNETITSVIASNGISVVGMESFRECSNLKSVSLPESVTEIGGGAFYYCYKLEQINLPVGIKTIEDFTFSDCTSLKTIDIPSAVTTIGDCAFQVCHSLQVVRLNEGLTAIGEYAFSSCQSLEKIKLPKSLTTIGAEAFAFTRLTSVTIPEKTIEIGEDAFISYYVEMERVAILNKTADISIDSSIFRGSPTIYCYRYSGADAWAQNRAADIVYLDDNDFAAVGSVSLPASMRIAAGKTDWVPLSIFPDLGELDIMWISENGDVATVSNGVITAKAKGETEITVIIGDKTASMTLTVYLELTSFDLSATEITIEAGSTHQLSCTNIAPAGADAVFTYESSNALAASVDENGLITASAIGDAVITVTSDSGVERSCTVHVVRPAT